MKVSTRLSLAEYFLYSGFVVLTLLQVVSLERVTGPLSQALRLCNLKLLLTWRIIVCGQDMMLFNLIILLPLCMLWLYESDHLRVGYLSRSLNLWFIGILRDA